MEPIKAISLGLQQSFVFSGRTRRASYLWFLAFAVSLLGILLVLTAALVPPERQGFYALIIIGMLYLPVTAAGVRRLHDAGYSGSMIFDPLKPALATWLVLAFLWLVARSTHLGVFSIILATLFAAKAIVFALALIVIGVTIASLTLFSNTMSHLLLPSDPGSNKYGPNPNEVTQ